MPIAHGAWDWKFSKLHFFCMASCLNLITLHSDCAITLAIHYIPPLCSIWSKTMQQHIPFQQRRATFPLYSQALFLLHSSFSLRWSFPETDLPFQWTASCAIWHAYNCFWHTFQLQIVLAPTKSATALWCLHNMPHSVSFQLFCFMTYSAYLGNSMDNSAGIERPILQTLIHVDNYSVVNELSWLKEST